MPPLKRYRIFISHAWTYNESYHRLVKMLNSAPYFYWENYSVPKYDPKKTKTKRGLYLALQNQVKPTNVVIVLAGMYVNHREWIENEIKISKYFKKPVIGIYPWESVKVPVIVRNSVKALVKWNTQSIINAIRKFAIRS